MPTWRRGKECLGTTKVLDNFAALVALGVATIHSPRRCGTLPRPGPRQRRAPSGIRIAV